MATLNIWWKKDDVIRNLQKRLIDPPGPGQYVVIVFTHSVRPSVRKTTQRYSVKTKHATTLYGTWWVTLKSPVLYPLFFSKAKQSKKKKEMQSQARNPNSAGGGQGTLLGN